MRNGTFDFDMIPKVKGVKKMNYPKTDDFKIDDPKRTIQNVDPKMEDRKWTIPKWTIRTEQSKMDDP